MKKSDHQMIQEVLDGEVSKESFDAFQQRMRGEPDLVKFYGEYARLHHTLSEEYEDAEPSISQTPENSGRVRPMVPWILSAIAVALAVLAFHWKSAATVKPPETIAGVRFSEDAVWRGEGIFTDSRRKQAMQKSSSLEILQGIAEVTLNGGGSALIEGPASLTVVSAESLHLAAGKAKFSTGSPGVKLVVTTPSMTAENLGTEFGLKASPDSPDELHVFKGKVSARINGSNTGELLEEGQAGRIVGTD
ncbi:MAG: hypothetical protein EOP85_12010, partial [Verrucomicrobiaceae bacterium]